MKTMEHTPKENDEIDKAINTGCSYLWWIFVICFWIKFILLLIEDPFNLFEDIFK